MSKKYKFESPNFKYKNGRYYNVGTFKNESNDDFNSEIVQLSDSYFS